MDGRMEGRLYSEGQKGEGDTSTDGKRNQNKYGGVDRYNAYLEIRKSTTLGGRQLSGANAKREQWQEMGPL